jgi:hypothetical protein
MRKFISSLAFLSLIGCVNTQPEVVIKKSPREELDYNEKAVKRALDSMEANDKLRKENSPLAKPRDTAGARIKTADGSIIIVRELDSSQSHDVSPEVIVTDKNKFYLKTK